MNQRITLTLIGILAALSIWNAWRAHQMSEQLQAIVMQNGESALAQTASDTLKDAQPDNTDATASIQSNTSGNDKAQQSGKGGIAYRKKTTRDQGGAASNSKEVKAVLAALSNPSVKKRIGSISKEMAQKQEDTKWQAKKEVNKESRLFELNNFADEKGYEDTVKGQLKNIVDQYSEESTAIWIQVNDGEISWMDARTEWKALKSCEILWIGVPDAGKR